MYQQTPSHLYGGEALIHLHPHPIHWLHIKASYSYVIGKQKSGEYLPFIPAQRMKLEVKTTKDQFFWVKNLYLLGSIQYVLPQNQPSLFEQTSPGYSIVNFGLGTNIKLNDQTITFNLNISNIFNTEYIDHLSTLKDMNILDMGRSINFRISLPFSIVNK